MAYTKQTWATGDTITAEKLNHMESGIEDNNTFDVKLRQVGADAETTDKTYDEIVTAFTNGKVVRAYFESDATNGFSIDTKYDDNGYKIYFTFIKPIIMESYLASLYVTVATVSNNNTWTSQSFYIQRPSEEG